MTHAQPNPRRREVLETLRDAEQPMGVTDVAELMAIHPNTARFHLDALVAEGTVESRLSEPSGPGRPRTVYVPRPGMDRGGVRSFRLLARILLSQLVSTAPDAHEQATEAGRAWGRYLVNQIPPFQEPTARQATDRLTALLADLGFDPEPEADDPVPERIRLRHCPFLELAEEYGAVVCPVHLGLMQGALTALRAPVAVTRLDPFSQPGACLTHLVAAGAA